MSYKIDTEQMQAQQEIRPHNENTILFGGVEMLVEHKDDRCEHCVEGRTHDVQDGEPVIETCASCHGTGTRIPPEVAERQALTYQQIIDREA
jgi:cytochrome c2